MNQQRSRRFRAAKESEEMKQLKEEKKIEIERNGGRLPPPDPKKEKFDSNCITPGTGFMDRLAKALRFYVSERLIFFSCKTRYTQGWNTGQLLLRKLSSIPTKIEIGQTQSCPVFQP